MNNCNNGGPIPAVDNPCEYLPQLRAAYYQLLAGQSRAQVRNGEQWLTFQRADTKTLEREVRRLELLCGCDAHKGRAVRVTAPFHAPHRRRFDY